MNGVGRIMRSREYPAYTILETIDFIRKFRGFPLDKPLSYDIAARNIGVSKTTKSFKYSISAAKQYGLITTSTGEIMHFTDTGKRVIQKENIDKNIMMNCFKHPKLYEELIKDYNGKSLPSIVKLETILLSNYSIAPNATKKAAEIFLDTAEEANAVMNGILSVEMNTFDTDMKTEEPKYTFDQTNHSEKGASCSSVEHKNYEQKDKDEFASPLSIPFGDKRKAVLYMPMNSTPEEAEYVQEMIALMFKRVYGIRNYR